MTDCVDKATHSRTMAAIRSKDTKQEKWLRSALHKQGFRFRLHNKKLLGSPDLVLRKYHASYSLTVASGISIRTVSRPSP